MSDVRADIVFDITALGHYTPDEFLDLYCKQHQVGTIQNAAELLVEGLRRTHRSRPVWRILVKSDQ